MGRGKPALLCIAALLLMVLATVLPPRHYHGPGDVFIPENGRFKETLARFNVTSLWDCTPRSLVFFECSVTSMEELNETLWAFSDLPHDPITLYRGEGGSFHVLLTKGSFQEKLPPTCIVSGSKNTTLTDGKAVELSRELRAWRELEDLLSKPAEKEFVHNITAGLERSLELRGEENLCNFTLLTVQVTYPEPRSNVPLMAFLWAGAGVLALAGVIWSDGRDKKLIFVALILLSVIFIGAYTHGQWIRWNSERALSMVLNINESNATLKDASNFGVLYVTLDGRGKAERLLNLLGRFNVSVVVHEDGPRTFRLDGTLPLSELEAFKNASRDVGAFYLHNESHLYEELLADYERENKIIKAHLEELSPESRKTLEEILKENEEVIENLKEAMNGRVQLMVLVSLPSTPTPEAYHDLSARLTFIGAFFVLGCLFTCVADGGRNR